MRKGEKGKKYLKKDRLVGSFASEGQTKDVPALLPDDLKHLFSSK